jgi:hypothetical protein
MLRMKRRRMTNAIIAVTAMSPTLGLRNSSMAATVDKQTARYKSI